MYFEDLHYYKSLISNPMELIHFALHHDLTNDSAAWMAVNDMAEEFGLATIPNEPSCHIPPFQCHEAVYFITKKAVHAGTVDCVANTMTPPPNIYVYIKTPDMRDDRFYHIIPLADIFRSKEEAEAELARRLSK